MAGWARQSRSRTGRRVITSERPILFSAPMVRALLDGRKTQTRRVVKPSRAWPIGFVGGAGDQNDPSCYGFEDLNSGQWWTLAADSISNQIPCPYGAPGDRLWVREAWRVGKPHDATAPRDILPPLVERGKGVTVLYQAGGWRSVGPRDREEPVYRDDAPMPEWAGKARPSMFMPRAFSRITLEITIVRIERLDRITEEDAEAEGAAPAWLDADDNETVHAAAKPTYRQGFARLWRDINGDESWGTNPWVWVVEFKRIEA